MDTNYQSDRNASRCFQHQIFQVLNWKSYDKSHCILLLVFCFFLYEVKIYYTHSNITPDSLLQSYFSISLVLFLAVTCTSRFINKNHITIHYNTKEEEQHQRHMCFKDEIESNNHHDSIYCFSVYHHQRWLFPTGWNDLTHDRPAWSDVHLEETPSIDEFQLPPALVLPCQQKKKIIEWNWLDPHWFVSTENIDQHDSQGWQYGDSRWQHWRRQPYGFGIFTRRRLWIRRAQRTERWISTESIFSEDLFSDWESTSSLSDKSTL